MEVEQAGGLSEAEAWEGVTGCGISLILRWRFFIFTTSEVTIHLRNSLYIKNGILMCTIINDVLK